MNCSRTNAPIGIPTMIAIYSEIPWIAPSTARVYVDSVARRVVPRVLPGGRDFRLLACRYRGRRRKVGAASHAMGESGEGWNCFARLDSPSLKVLAAVVAGARGWPPRA